MNANCEIGKSHGMMEHLIVEKGGCNDGLLSRPSHSEYIIGVVGTNFQFKMKYFTNVITKSFEEAICIYSKQCRLQLNNYIFLFCQIHSNTWFKLFSNASYYQD